MRGGAWIVRVVAFGPLLGATTAADAGPEATLPDVERPGPFAVGVTTFTFQDPARPDARGTPRGLKTEIWYPARDEARDLPRNRFTDFLDRGSNPALQGLVSLALRAAPADLDRRFRNSAVRDAPCREGRFPLLLFSHGNGATRIQSVFWCEHMASHGYVVAAPDHTGNAVVTTLGGRIVVADRSKEGIERSRVDRPRDLSLLIDALARLDKGDDSRFAGRIDVERVGAAGHSFGASSVLAAADADPRIRAVSPWASAQSLARKDVPVLLLLATEDAALPPEGSAWCRRWFATLPGPAYLVELRNGGHFSFTEMYQLDPKHGDGVGTGTRVTNGEPIAYVGEDVAHRIVNGVTLAFFDRYLNGVTARDAYLSHTPLPEEASVVVRPGSGASPLLR